MGRNGNDERGRWAGAAGHRRRELRAQRREELRPAAELRAQEEPARDILVEHGRHHARVRGGPVQAGPAAPTCGSQEIGVAWERDAATWARGGTERRQSCPAIETRSEHLPPLERSPAGEAVRREEEREDRSSRAAKIHG